MGLNGLEVDTGSWYCLMFGIKMWDGNLDLYNELLREVVEETITQPI